MTPLVKHCTDELKEIIAKKCTEGEHPLMEDVERLDVSFRCLSSCVPRALTLSSVITLRRFGSTRILGKQRPVNLGCEEGANIITRINEEAIVARKVPSADIENVPSADIENVPYARLQCWR